MQFTTGNESVLLWDLMTDSNEMDKAFVQFMTGNGCFTVGFNDGLKCNGQGFYAVTTGNESVLLWDLMMDSSGMDKAFMQFMAGNQHVLLWDFMTEWTRLWESRKLCLIFNGPSISTATMLMQADTIHVDRVLHTLVWLQLTDL